MVAKKDKLKIYAKSPTETIYLDKNGNFNMKDVYPNWDLPKTDSKSTKKK